MIIASSLSLDARAQATAPADQAYPILTASRSKVGDRSADEFVVTIEETSQTKWTDIPDLVRDRNRYAFRLIGVTQIKAVNEANEAIETEITVQKCTERIDNADIELFKPGQKIQIDLRGESTRYTVDGQKPSPELVEKLERIVPVDPPGYRDADPVLGHDVKLKVGQTYTADPAELSKLYEIRYERMPAENITRTVKLLAAEPVDGKLSLKIEMAQRVTCYNPKVPADRKQEIKSMSASQDGRSIYIIPLDPSDPTLDQHFTGTSRYIADGQTPEGAYHFETTVLADWRLTRRALIADATTGDAPKGSR